MNKQSKIMNDKSFGFESKFAIVVLALATAIFIIFIFVPSALVLVSLSDLHPKNSSTDIPCSLNLSGRCLQAKFIPLNEAQINSIKQQILNGHATILSFTEENTGNLICSKTDDNITKLEHIKCRPEKVNRIVYSVEVDLLNRTFNCVVADWQEINSVLLMETPTCTDEDFLYPYCSGSTTIMTPERNKFTLPFSNCNINS